MKKFLISICIIIGAVVIAAVAALGIGRAITGSWDVRDWRKSDIEQSDNLAVLDNDSNLQLVGGGENQ
ncbi:MAG: hypothetical protein K2N47_03150 [Clostridia bacterium]|nr:hypothetical protein [Clostridia bacterium]